MAIDAAMVIVVAVRALFMGSSLVRIGLLVGGLAAKQRLDGNAGCTFGGRIFFADLRAARAGNKKRRGAACVHLQKGRRAGNGYSSGHDRVDPLVASLKSNRAVGSAGRRESATGQNETVEKYAKSSHHRKQNPFR